MTKDDAASSVVMMDLHGYDPFGKPRGETWTASGERLHPTGDRGATTDRGFTGHEHLDVHYLIHMNGRVYDYRLGRFLSVDPIFSNPLDSQSLNPYSYIGNNPLSGTDPTGYAPRGSICAGTGGASNCSNGLGSSPVERQYVLTDGGEVVAIGTLAEVLPIAQSSQSSGANPQVAAGGEGADVSKAGGPGEPAKREIGVAASHQGSSMIAPRDWGRMYGWLTAQLPLGVGTHLPNPSDDADFVGGPLHKPMEGTSV